MLNDYRESLIEDAKKRKRRKDARTTHGSPGSKRTKTAFSSTDSPSYSSAAAAPRPPTISLHTGEHTLHTTVLRALLVPCFPPPPLALVCSVRTEPSVLLVCYVLVVTFFSA